MKTIIILCCIICSFTFENHQTKNPNYQKTIQIETHDTAYYRQRIALIQKVKKFSQEKLKFQETNNFLIVDTTKQGARRYNAIRYKEKTKTPFSRIDPDLHSVRTDCATLYDAIQELKIDTLQYDVCFYENQIAAGGTIVTLPFLNEKESEFISDILHEDWHNNNKLPRHFDEAAAVLIGCVGSLLFLGDSSRIDDTLKVILDESLLIKECYDYLVALSALFEKKFLSRAEYFQRREIAYLFFNEKRIRDFSRHWLWYTSAPTWSNVWLSDIHTYVYYFPLLYELFYACDKNLATTIKTLHAIPFNGPPFIKGMSARQYFNATREQEKKTELYLKNKISIKLPQ